MAGSMLGKAGGSVFTPPSHRKGPKVDKVDEISLLMPLDPKTLKNEGF